MTIIMKLNRIKKTNTSDAYVLIRNIIRIRPKAVNKRKS